VAVSGRNRTPARVLIGFFALVVALMAALAGVHTFGSAQLTPKLGLDLEGGTQLILEPRLVGSETVSSDQIAQARDIIVQRVDAQGVAGAEVTTQGDRNIVVSMPGTPDRQTEEAIRRSSQMQFRPVLAAGAGTPTPAPTATDGSGNGSGNGSGDSSATPKASSSSTSDSSPTSDGSTDGSTGTSTDNAALPRALSKSGTSSPTSSSTSGTSSKGTAPKDPTDLAWITPKLTKEFQQLDCTQPGALDQIVDDPKKPLVTCNSDGTEKYILGPVVVRGDQIADASAGYQVGPTGQPTNIVEIRLTFTNDAKQTYADISREMVTLQSPRNRLASTLDSRVIVAPQFNEAITDGQASITGNFTIDSARSLADQLKFGALPLSFDLQTRQQISPTLGEEQLRLGLMAGLVGLLLVVVYSLFQYRALGFVTVASLVVAGTLAYLAITLLGWSQNYRLDMAGVTGLIVAIGITADSFIVYFERVRDEVREGRTLRTAVDTGWVRARRTILAADGVSFMGAAVLYILASSNVRGFAFTLGLTTLIDVLVVFLFTHPLVALLSSTKFFGGGHRWSGVSPDRLGAKDVRYVGRGRVAGPRPAASSEGSA
jgi:preprotein translocase subunit SecD